uniref:Telethonin n=1 Tax=Rousettus aegyptiacus TaxID=9407 RepID=A0A7J8GH52_ROUAE|nr:titin-cap [Rousettus aegyptiacus]
MATSELSCQVSEENCERREAFWAEWKDLTLSTRPEEGCSLHEEDTQRHETYHQQGQCQEYQLPYQRVLPLPIFTPTKMGAAKEEREDTPIQLRELLALETALGGQCMERQDVAEITKQLPPVVPVSKPGTLRRSLSRSMSQEAQRG